MASTGKATAVANPNIAFVKYWGKADAGLNLPANASVSMNLGALTTVTTVQFRPSWPADMVTVDGQPAVGRALSRVLDHVDRVRARAGIAERAIVASQSDYPPGTGLASSAAAFAALTLAAAQAAGLALEEAELSRLARLGSGSACRSVPSGFCLWEGQTDETSFARSLAAADHWDLCDVVAIVTRKHKAVGSPDGHALASTSPYHQARLRETAGWLEAACIAVEKRDLASLGPIAEADALAMHGVMMTSRPPLLYWSPGTVAVMTAVVGWRAAGLPVYFTLDAGPNVHCLCEGRDAPAVESRLRALEGVQEVIVSRPGRGVRRVDYHLF